MLAAHHRFPSRGSMATRTRMRGRSEGPMLTEPPPEAPTGMFAGNPLPIQNLVGAAIRELWTSLLDAPTAIRLAGTSARPRYFGTVTPEPQIWRTPAEVNGEDSVRAGVITAGNAPQMANKTAGQGSAPRIAATLPQRSR